MGLQNLLEDYRNWVKTQEWKNKKQDERLFGGDPVLQEEFEKWSGGFSPSNLGGGLSGLAGAIKASHGSPHAHTKFDFSKIGTGEGAQAYGHGGYFGQGFDSPVAKEYQKQLAGDVFDVAGDVFDPSSLEHLNIRAITRRGDLEGAISTAKEIALSDSPAAEKAKNDLSTLLEIQNKGGLNPSQGYLYNVELKWPDAAREAADPLGEHHLLDWDAPITDESLLSQKLKGMYRGYLDKILQKDIGGNAPTGGLIYNRLADLMSEGKRSDVFENAANYGAKNASQELADLGIPGIRYLDQGSRGTGEGTRNYVMFDDRFPNIVSRNGVSLADLLRK